MTTHNFQKVFNVFSKHYVLVPLEIFGDNSYKTLVSTLLSSRTKDEVTLAASLRLFKKVSNFKALSQMTQSGIATEIYPVGFYKTKAKHLKLLSKIILDDHFGKVPNTQEDLIKLPGVGRKTANLVLNRAFGTPAIAVDTHVHRITNLLGWVKTKTPQQTETQLNKILPKKYWSNINRLFVSIGRQFNSKNKLSEFLQKEKLT